LKRSVLALVPVLTFSALLAGQTPPSKPWTVADIWRKTPLTGKPPGDMSWAPDGSKATYISDDGDLMQVDAASGKLSVLVERAKFASLNSSAMNEKDKDHRARYGQANYTWDPDSKHLLFDTSGSLFLFSTDNGVGVQVGTTGAGSGDDPKFSPDGSRISFLRNHNLFVHELKSSGEATALTRTHEDTLLNGEVDWVYEEELDVRSNYFWSPDSRHLVYLQMNEESVPSYPITDWIPTHASVDHQRYPQPGDPNPVVKLAVVDAGNGRTNWIKMPTQADDYVPRFGWVNRKVIWFETLSRDHKHKGIYFVDPQSGAGYQVFNQTDDKFFDETYDVTFVGDNSFLIVSWRDGHTHIYRYTFNAANPTGGEAHLDRELESGDYEVESIKNVDTSTNTVYYLSNEGDPREEQLWAVKLDGTGKRKVTETAGSHDPNFAPGKTVYLDKASSTMSPMAISLCHDGQGCTSVWKPKPIEGYPMIAPQQLELKAADGKTTLYATLLLPAAMTSPASVPLIINPYGGPHAQTVHDDWGGATFLFDQLLAQNGYAVLHVDNRGMGNRGRDFEQAAYHNFGPVQLEDQLAAIDQALQKYPQLDRNRQGWWGWSWGGTFTLYAMTHSDRFKAGISVAPVTDWRNYDSIYTERYMGRPADNPEGYKENSVVTHAEDLKGHLLLVHGTGDDNVHMENSIQFIQKLIDADIPYDLQLYPRKTHSIAGPEARTHLFNRILQHFDMYLKNAAGPAKAENDASTSQAGAGGLE
jgi:dipeptidyl-peptidase-4